ncbi:hypothetical protein [Epilithonimonas sp. UC225_85]|uniref:hypothetical protein n=1 Tax=Epilithonimonas sp. UC225_85 TaxID=3350167 RepID=UPI0036D3D035
MSKLAVISKKSKMTEFFHVSRADITQVSKFNLDYFPGHISCEEFYTIDEFKQHKIDLYPQGISRHGEMYLHTPFLSVGENLRYTPNELTLETVFELVRQLKFPERKSRFVCSFGCLTLEDAKFILNKTFNGIGNIYKVKCENYSEADMNLVRQTGSVIGLQIIAEKYWSGKSSRNPFWEVLMENPISIIEKIS